jgi:uncharacterized protein (DUF58 family)
LRSRGRAALLALALVFLLTGMALRNYVLLSLLIPLSLFLFLGMIWSREQGVRLDATWEIPEEQVMEGETIKIGLELGNPADRTLSVMVSVHLPEEAAVVNGRSVFPVSLRPGEMQRFTYELRFPRRGRYDIGPIEINWTDWSWMGNGSISIDKKGSFRVMPFVYPLDRCPLRPKLVRMPLGNLTSRLLGSGSEFHSLREYLPGDELRRVNWKASARSEMMFVNNDLTDRSGDVTIVLDARASTGTFHRSDALVDHEVNAAVSLAAYYLRERDRVGLLVMGEFLDVVRPGYGKRQFLRIVDRLLEVRRKGQRSSLTINHAIQRYFPANSLLLIVSPLDDRGMVENIERLVQQGHVVTVITPAPEAFRPVEEGKAGQLGDRLRRLGREDDLYELRGFCQVVEWDTSVPLSTCFSGVRGR